MAAEKPPQDQNETTLIPTGREETLALWAELGIAEEALAINEKGTIQGKRKRAADTHDNFTIERLPILVTSEADEEKAKAPMVDLRLGEVIGEGGMGQVQAARQVPLHREVAIKRVKKNRQNPRAFMSLLREAWVMGAIDHPNVLPIYTLGADASGDPIFVMKRIEGSSWQALMHNPSHPIRQQSAQDHLGWNLSILRQVCNGLSYAHAKGIIHRDLKPENVMIGRFGEVYLLDWGIAVSVDHAPDSPIPPATKELAGTPAFMAPEMAALCIDEFSQRTDVYQLGAILHHILVAKPKHTGETLMEVIYQAIKSSPYTYPKRVPTELADLCNKATHTNPAKRPADAAAFAEAIEQFIEHRASIQLTEETSHLARQLDGLLEEARQSTQSASGDTLLDKTTSNAILSEEKSPEDRHNRIYEIFSQCQFGFQQALRSWPENKSARDALQLLFADLTRYEIQQGDHKSACLHYAKLDAPDEALAKALDALAAADKDASERVAKLEQIQRDTNPQTGMQGRLLVCVLAAAIELPFFLSYSRTFGWVEFKQIYFLIFGGCFSGGALAFAIWFRRAPDRNIVGIRIANSVVIASLFIWVLIFFGWSRQQPTADIVAMLFLALAFFFCLNAALFEPFLWLPASSNALGSLLIMLFPAWTFDIAAIFGPLSMLLVPLSWHWFKDRFDPMEFNKRLEK